MELLEKRILADGTVRPGHILKVDSFLNHQIDANLVREMALEYKRLFGALPITKILTIEASGIAIAAIAALEFGVPMVFAKKTESKNLDGEVYTSKVHSYTKGREYDIMVAKRFLSPGDKVLILDDFLAVGKALNGLLEIVAQAGAECIGIGVAIEKGFQGGGDRLREAGYNLHSLAIIQEMGDDFITFRPQH